MNWIKKLVDDYYLWLKDNTAVLEGKNGWGMISTPFLGLFNDYIELYVKKNNKKILISDNGETLNNLELTGVSFKRPERREILDRILINYGIKIQDKELVVDCSENNFFQKKHNFISAVLEISDLYVLSKQNITSIFKEEVRSYLEELNVIYTADFIARGTTGLEFTFDFLIQKRNEELVIKSFNTLNNANFGHFMFAWEDVKSPRERSSRKNVIPIAIINDESKLQKDDYFSAFDSKGAKYIKWSEKKNSLNINLLQSA